MAQFYVMPSISPTMEVGVLIEWRVQEGESFEPQTVLAEVGTDKANMEAEIFDAGVLIKHLIGEDDEVPAGFPIAIWGSSVDEEIDGLIKEFAAQKAALDGGGAATPEAQPSAPQPKAATPSPAPAPRPSAPPVAPKEREWMGRKLSPLFQDPPGDIRAATTAKRIVASPLARAVAQDLGVDLARVQGSGPGGRIVRDDVETASKATPAQAQAREDEVVRNSPMRKTIARRLLKSYQDIPVFFLTVDFDMQGFVDLRSQLKANLPDVKISYNDMLIAAVARSLREYPRANASWGDSSIVRYGRVDVGVAVALDDGLITPVIRNADQKGLAAIAGEVRELAGRARQGKLSTDEYTGGTFTISNLGMFGIEHFTAIINPPEAAILAVGGLRKEPVFDDQGHVQAAWRMKMTMTCDHRVIDGAVGAKFLQVLRKYVENPYLMLVRSPCPNPPSTS